jgi:hypothetical protein
VNWECDVGHSQTSIEISIVKPVYAAEWFKRVWALLKSKNFEQSSRRNHSYEVG